MGFFDGAGTLSKVTLSCWWLMVTSESEYLMESAGGMATRDRCRRNSETNPLFLLRTIPSFLCGTGALLLSDTWASQNLSCGRHIKHSFPAYFALINKSWFGLYLCPDLRNLLLLKFLKLQLLFREGHVQTSTGLAGTHDGKFFLIFFSCNAKVDIKRVVR